MLTSVCIYFKVAMKNERLKFVLKIKLEKPITFYEGNKML